MSLTRPLAGAGVRRGLLATPTGLDPIELVTDVEEHFGVEIADSDVGSIRTVGDLVRLLESRVASREAPPPCLSLLWFLRLRRLTREIVGDPQRRFRPSQAETHALSAAERRRLWRRLPELLGDQPPRLCRPTPLRIGLVSAVLVAAVAVYIAAPHDAEHAFAVWLSVIGGAVGLHLATVPFRVVPPVGYRTFGDLTRRLVAREAIRVGFPTGARRSSLLLDELRPMVVTQLGVEPDEVTMEARWVEDLNCD